MNENIEVDKALMYDLISKIDYLTDRFKQLETEIKSHRKPYMTLKEVCEYTGCGKTWIYEHKDKIGFSKSGGKVKFKRVDVEIFMHDTYTKRA